jgi:hypothetical protein
MSEKNIQPLIINTKTKQSPGSEYVWNKIPQAEKFVADILTNEINENSDELNKLISGIPTPFARTQMFKYAISFVKSDNDDATGLMSFYKDLQAEWKGLITCFALDSQPISVEKIVLDYSDGKSFLDTDCLYETKGSLGNMLFENKFMWCDQNQIEHPEQARTAKPFIYVLRYNGVIIGGTSPESLVFTSPNYNIDCKTSFYSSLDKKFTDPLDGKLSREDTEKLHSYVKYLLQSIGSFGSQFKMTKPDLQKVGVFLSNWLDDIKKYAQTNSHLIDEDAIVPNLSIFQAPFDKLFNYQTKLYGFGGRISSDISTLELTDDLSAIEVELDELLLDPNKSNPAEVIFNNDSDFEKCGISLLAAQTERGTRYFTLPFSEKGLIIFQNEIDEILDYSSDNKSNLTATYDLKSKTLSVIFEIDINGNTTSFHKDYKEPTFIEGQRVMCWPDFVSKIWNKYYLYSEIPHNSPDLKAIPLRANKENWSLLTDDNLSFIKIDKNDKFRDGKDAEILVEYDINKIGSSEFKYEIYESNQPFKGLEIHNKNNPCGYFILKNIKSGHPSTIKDYTNVKTSLNPARVGFDFGSNNTCISFCDKNSNQPELLKYKNRRKMLLGLEFDNNDKQAASPSELFFFQNEETISNQIKSMVMIHDIKRITEYERDNKIAIKSLVKGGFPVFEKNIPVDESDDSTYTTRFNGQPFQIKYNMKWSRDDMENAYKEGLLKLLFLKTQAELFYKEKFAEDLVWAYPTAMTPSILMVYSDLWRSISSVNALDESKFPACKASTYNSSAVASKGSSGSGNPFGGSSVASSSPFGGANEASSSPFGGASAASSDPFGNPSHGTNDTNSSFSSNSPDEIESLSESFAVCKYAISMGGLQPDVNTLVLGFDVGGSTTDILAVAQHKNKSGQFPASLIKQSSIKFAAGKLADATNKSKKFHKFLVSFCNANNLYIHGVTVGENKINSSTASYYYNVIVDRLKTEQQLDAFYRGIAKDCPELFIINTYMTGLIMFYAGQLSLKVREDQEENKSNYQNPFNKVDIGFYGKGGRMFDWLKSIGEQEKKSYYDYCFAAGYGVKAKDHLSGINITHSKFDQVKAEVSFGLSTFQKIEKSDSQISEIIGEEGFKYQGNILESGNAVEPKYLLSFGSQFSNPNTYVRFTEFCQIFYGLSNKFFGFDLPTIQNDINSMKLMNYLQSIPEYQQATREDQFDFEMPIIILEGMCFLDTVLMNKLF